MGGSDVTPGRKRAKLLVAVLGTIVTIGATVVGGHVRNGISKEIDGLRSSIGSVERDLALRDRFFDLGIRRRQFASESLLQFYGLPESRTWVFDAVLENHANALVDSLVYGHQAATGVEPERAQQSRYDDIVRRVGEVERKARSLEKGRGRVTTTSDVDARAMAELESARDHLTREYWQSRVRILTRRAEAGRRISRLEDRRDDIVNLALGLQIFGVIIVLAKDLI